MNTKPIFGLIFLLVIGSSTAFVVWLFVMSPSLAHTILAVLISCLIYGLVAILLGLLAAMFEAADWKWERKKQQHTKL